MFAIIQSWVEHDSLTNERLEKMAVLVNNIEDLESAIELRDALSNYRKLTRIVCFIS